MKMYDCIVVGAGVVGSATAYELAKRRCKVLLLEQFSLPHTRGSSHGQARGFRMSYYQEHYAQMTRDALPLWRQLEEETGQELFKQSGLLTIQKPPYDLVKETLATCKATGQNCNLLDGNILNKMFPGKLSLSSDYKGYIETEAGVLKPEKCLSAFRSQVLALGGDVIEEAKVTAIVPGDIVAIKTSKGVFHSKSLVIAAGAWTNKLVQPLGLNLPLEPTRIEVFYWKEKREGFYKDFPNIGDLTNGSEMIYGIFGHEYPGLVKITSHGGFVCDPDDRDGGFTPEQSRLPVVSRFVKENFPGLHHTPSIIEHCIYTTTPDEEFIMDRHFEHRNIVIGCGMSGHGFKMAPATGKILADLALNKTPEYDTTPMMLKRFSGIRSTPKSKY